MTTTSTLPLTPEQTEGPYWSPGSPERTNLREPDTKGEPFAVSGRVLNTRGEPVAGAWVDFWQCYGEGVYDNKGFRLRGHQFTDEQGRYRLETVVPAEYDDYLYSAEGQRQHVFRTSHIHAKVKGRERMTLTTQLYFPDAPGNERDGIYVDRCLMEIVETPSGKEGHFDFVIRIGSDGTS